MSDETLDAWGSARPLRLQPFPCVETTTDRRLKIVEVVTLLAGVFLLASAQVQWASSGTYGVELAVIGVLMIPWAVGSLIRSRSYRFRFTDEGVEYRGMFRGFHEPWTRVMWVGWILIPGNACMPTTFTLAVGVRGRKLPCWLPSNVSLTTLAVKNDMSESALGEQLQRALADRNVRYRPRIPDISPAALWIWQLVALLLLLGVLWLPYLLGAS